MDLEKGEGASDLKDFQKKADAEGAALAAKIKEERHQKALAMADLEMSNEGFYSSTIPDELWADKDYRAQIARERERRARKFEKQDDVLQDRASPEAIGNAYASERDDSL